MSKINSHPIYCFALSALESSGAVLLPPLLSGVLVGCGADVGAAVGPDCCGADVGVGAVSVSWESSPELSSLSSRPRRAST